MDNTTAFLLAGGMGRRLRGITCLPKCMISINDKPVLFHWIDALSEICEEVYVSLFYRGNHMRAMINENYSQAGKLNIICDAVRGQWAHAELIANQAKTDKVILILADNFWEGFSKGQEGIDKLRELLIIPSGNAGAIGMMPQVFSSGIPGDLVWSGLLVLRTEMFQSLVSQFPANTIIGESIIPFIKEHYKYHLFLMPGLYVDIGSEATIAILKEEGYNVRLSNIPSLKAGGICQLPPAKAGGL